MSSKSSNISEPINHLSATEHKWFAVYTKYKCEKYVVNQLSKKGISAYLPLTTVTKKYVSKVKRYQVPLINCYVFVKIKKNQYISVLETEYVMSFIKQRQSLISIPESEIDTLRLVVGEIENVEAGNVTLEKGDEVEIIAGNLTGIKGQLISKEGGNRFVVALKTVGLQLSMIIDRSLMRLTKKRTVGKL